MPCLQSQEGGVVLSLFVQPRASRNQIVGLQGNELKLRLTSPPVDNAANKLCIQFLAKHFGLPKGDVKLIAGDKSRHKRLFLSGVTLDRARQILADYLQS